MFQKFLAMVLVVLFSAVLVSCKKKLETVNESPDGTVFIDESGETTEVADADAVEVSGYEVDNLDVPQMPIVDSVNVTFSSNPLDFGDRVVLSEYPPVSLSSDEYKKVHMSVETSVDSDYITVAVDIVHEPFGIICPEDTMFEKEAADAVGACPCGEELSFMYISGTREELKNGCDLYVTFEPKEAGEYTEQFGLEFFTPDNEGELMGDSQFPPTLTVTGRGIAK